MKLKIKKKNKAFFVEFVVCECWYNDFLIPILIFCGYSDIYVF